MISLVVVIVSIIILSAIAVTAGYRYITQSREAEKEALVASISEAAYRRQNDYNVDAQSYYTGSAIFNESDINSSNFRNLPENFEDEKTKIATELDGLTPLWFVLDAESAKGLGLQDVDKYDKYLISSFDDMNAGEEYSPVALVEYITGSAYLVDIKNTYDLEVPSTHEHIWIVATCEEPATCRICGETLGDPLGHDIVEATCTQASYCRRCGKEFAPALGHDFEGAGYTYDAVKHWIECKRGCGTKKEEESHTKNYVSIPRDATTVGNGYHHEICYICGWESAPTEHTIKNENIDETHHRAYCILCDYDEIHEDDGWHSDRGTHWKNCDICGDEILKENHVDNNHDSMCDVCGKMMDYTPPLAFDDGDIVVITRTTHQLEIEAETEDNAGGVGIAKYAFSIDGGTNWNEVTVGTNSTVATYKYENLVHNRDYTIIVRAIDKNNNYTDGRITARTYQVPESLIDYSLDVERVTSGSVNVTLKLPTLSLPQVAINELKIVYKIDGVSTDWQDYSTPIEVTGEENTVILAKIVDKRTPTPNSSNTVTTINVTNIDKTPPTVTIEGTNTTQAKTSHTATIRVRDEKAGIANGTIIQYAWALEGVTPTIWRSTQTTTSGQNVTVEVDTPSGVKGRYYLWVNQGVRDAVGNVTTEVVKSSIYFEVDDIAPELITRTMRNKTTGAIDELYVNTGAEITVTIVSDKELSQGPLVEIITTTGTKQARATSSDGINWTAKITADATFTEGLLNNVRFSDYLGASGKAGGNYTTTTDGVYITYDKTLPALEYINK